MPKEPQSIMAQALFLATAIPQTAALGHSGRTATLGPSQRCVAHCTWLLAALQSAKEPRTGAARPQASAYQSPTYSTKLAHNPPFCVHFCVCRPAAPAEIAPTEALPSHVQPGLALGLPGLPACFPLITACLPHVCFTSPLVHEGAPSMRASRCRAGSCQRSVDVPTSHERSPTQRLRAICPQLQGRTTARLPRCVAAIALAQHCTHVAYICAGCHTHARMLPRS